MLLGKSESGRSRYPKRPMGAAIGPCNCGPIKTGTRTIPKPASWCAACGRFVSFEAYQLAAAIKTPSPFGSRRRKRG